jgi:hypothetical protein
MTTMLTREEAQQVEQYIKPGALVPVDMQTTQLLVNALRTKLTQPEREWQGLTDEEIKRYKPVCADLDSFRAGVRAVEAKLKEKNAADA